MIIPSIESLSYASSDARKGPSEASQHQPCTTAQRTYARALLRKCGRRGTYLGSDLEWIGVHPDDWDRQTGKWLMRRSKQEMSMIIDALLDELAGHPRCSPMAREGLYFRP